jgi:hypothetical protein
MTETATSETVEAPKFDLNTLDETDRMLFDKTEQTIKSYNEAVANLKSLSGNEDEVTEGIRESDDPEIVSLREAVEKAQAALTKRQETLDATAREKAKAKIAENTDQAKVDELKASTEKMLKRIRATQTALVTDHGDSIKSLWTNLSNTRKSSGGNAEGRGAGVPRPRNFTVKVNGKVALLPNNSGDKVSSFSAAQKEIGEDDITTKDVQAGYFAEMGTNPEGWTPGKVVTYTLTSKSGKSYTVEAVKNRDSK